MRKQPWFQRLLAIIGTGLERAGQALRGQSGEPDSVNSDGPPAHWLDLLSTSEVPLVWMRQQSENAENPDPQEGWQTGFHSQGEPRVDGSERDSAEIPAAMDHGHSHESTFSAFFPEISHPELTQKIEWSQKTPEARETHRPERSGSEDKAPKPRTGMTIIPRPSTPSEPQSFPHYTSRNPVHLFLTPKVSQSGDGRRANQTTSKTPRYVQPQPGSQAEIHWPEGPSGTIAITPHYEPGQRSVPKEVSFSELSTKPNANKDFFAEGSSPVEHWPSLPSDRLAIEPESSSTRLEQIHRQRLEQEWRGEQ